GASGAAAALAAGAVLAAGASLVLLVVPAAGADAAPVLGAGASTRALARAAAILASVFFSITTAPARSGPTTASTAPAAAPGGIRLCAGGPGDGLGVAGGRRLRIGGRARRQVLAQVVGARARRGPCVVLPCVLVAHRPTSFAGAALAELGGALSTLPAPRPVG